MAREPFDPDAMTERDKRIHRILSACGQQADALYRDAIRIGEPFDPVVEVYSLDWFESSGARPPHFTAAIDLVEAQDFEAQGGITFFMRAGGRQELRRYLETTRPAAVKDFDVSPPPDLPLTVVLQTARDIAFHDRPAPPLAEILQAEAPTIPPMQPRFVFCSPPRS